MLHELADLVVRLRDEGIDAIVAGGCMRDHFHGTKPKDIDVFVPEMDATDLAAKLYSIGFVSCMIYGEYAGSGDDPRLDWVVEAEYQGHQFDFIHLRGHTPGMAPSALVEEFDCRLNQAWLEPLPTPHIRVSPFYPSRFYNQPNELINEVTFERAMYVTKKATELGYTTLTETRFIL